MKNFTKINIRHDVYEVIKEQAKEAHLSTTKYVELLLIAKLDNRIIKEVSKRKSAEVIMQP